MIFENNFFGVFVAKLRFMGHDLQAFLGRTERVRAENLVHSDVKMIFCSENISELFRMEK